MIETKSKRHPFQFSLRMLLLAVFIAAVGCVIVPPVWHRLFPPKEPTFDEKMELIISTMRTRDEGGKLLNDGLSPEERAKLEAQIEQAKDQPEHSNR